MVVRGFLGNEEILHPNPTTLVLVIINTKLEEFMKSDVQASIMVAECVAIHPVCLVTYFSTAFSLR